MSAPELAIIIPAFRVRFLERTLQSLAAQTDRRFKVYVGDDASPEPVAGLVKKYQDQLPLAYHRFDENLGGTALTRHWDRCIERTTEPWIWLFSDDDEMEPACVEALWREIEMTGGGFDLYRFNSRCINAQSEVIAVNDPYPVEESGRDFLLMRLLQERGSTAQELVFSRQAWKRAGGFPDYPLAWAADDTFIAGLGKNKPIRLIPGPRIRWRLSGTNITSVSSTSVLSRKILASRMFITWARDFLAEDVAGKNPFTSPELDAMTEAWFFRWLFYMRTRINWRIWPQVDRLAAEMWQRPRGYGWLKCFFWNCRMINEAVWRRLRSLWPKHPPLTKS